VTNSSQATSAVSPPGDYVSRADISRLAALNRAAVSNWIRRHPDFPRPERKDGQELFSVAEVELWLSHRILRAGERKADEVQGTTLGDRFRRNLEVMRGMPVSTSSRAPEAESARGHMRTEASAALTDRLWRAIVANGETVSLPEVVRLALILIYLRLHDPEAWANLTATSSGPLNILLEQLAYGHENRHPSLVGVLTGIPLSRWPSRLLARLIQVIEAVDGLAGGVGERRAALGETSDNLLQRLSETEGRGGDHLTPPCVVQLMIAMTDPQPGKRILDPWCRAGEILVSTAAHLSVTPSDGTLMRGSARYRSAWETTKISLAIHGIDARLDLRNDYPFSVAADDDKYDVILANPPFNMSHAASSDQLDSHRWRYGPTPEGNANFAWLQFVISSLSESGRAAVLMANGASSSQNPKERFIRSKMIEDGAVSCVVALPSHLFSSTSIPVTLWLLRYPTGKPEEVVLIDATSTGQMLNRSRRVLAASDINEIANLYIAQRQHETPDTTGPAFSNSVPAEQIQAQQSALNPPRYMPSPIQGTFDLEAASLAVQNLRDQIGQLHASASKIDAEVAAELARIVPWTH
jgi:type I restriction enzyme M protein